MCCLPSSDDDDEAGEPMSTITPGFLGRVLVGFAEDVDCLAVEEVGRFLADVLEARFFVETERERFLVVVELLLD